MSVGQTGTRNNDRSNDRHSEWASALFADGAIKVPGLLAPAMLAEVQACFEWSIANPGRAATRIYPGTPDEHYNDISNPKARAVYEPMLRAAPFADLLAQLWGSEHVWYLGEELFVKEGGSVKRSPWHQDTAYGPFGGEHLANVWISFDPLPKANSLEIVRGSHHGPLYDGAAYDDPDDDTKPMWGVQQMPRLPDIEAERRVDPHAWDVLCWPVDPGDVIICHSGALHGGAPVNAECPQRRTLVLRFWGDDAFYRPLPKSKPNYFHDVRDSVGRAAEVFGAMAPGDPFRLPRALQLR